MRISMWILCVSVVVAGTGCAERVDRDVSYAPPSSSSITYEGRLVPADEGYDDQDYAIQSSSSDDAVFLPDATETVRFFLAESECRQVTREEFIEAAAGKEVTLVGSARATLQSLPSILDQPDVWIADGCSDR